MYDPYQIKHRHRELAHDARFVNALNFILWGHGQIVQITRLLWFIIGGIYWLLLGAGLIVFMAGKRIYGIVLLLLAFGLVVWLSLR